MSNLKVHFQPSVIECRLYADGCYADKSPYVGSFVMHIIGETAYLSLLTGGAREEVDAKIELENRWDRNVDRQTEAYLKGLGVKTVYYTHNGKEQVREFDKGK